MKKRILVVLVMVLTSAGSAYAADSTAWQVGQTEDGSLYLLHDGRATPIQPVPITQDQLSKYTIDDQPWLTTGAVTLDGKGGLNTSPISLEGDYQVTWSTQSSKECLFDAQFKPTSSDYVYLNDFGSMDLKTANSGSTYMYGLPGETYYLYVNSNCDHWSVQAQPLQ